VGLSRRTILSLPGFAGLLQAAAAPPAERAKQMVSMLRSAQKAPGMAAAVWKQGSLVWSGAFGQADLEDGAAVSTKTRFRIGSLSKLLTTAAAARLYDRGLLDLDAPVQRYLPSFPLKSGKITVRLLLGHLAGVRHYGRSEYLNQQHYDSIAETLKTIEDAPVLHEPGTKYFYSSYGFNLLGAILEEAGSLDFRQLIRREVCDPLRLGSTTADENDQIIDGRNAFLLAVRY